MIQTQHPRAKPGLLCRPAQVLLLAAGVALGGCGQKGPLFIPKTPPAAQRATLPQTIFGGASRHDTASDKDKAQHDQDQDDSTGPDVNPDTDP